MGELLVITQQVLGGSGAAVPGGVAQSHGQDPGSTSISMDLTEDKSPPISVFQFLICERRKLYEVVT